MNIKQLILILGICAAGILSAEEVAAEWDFRSGIDSTDGKYTGKLCGTAVQDKSGLVIGKADKLRGQGFVLAQKYPELTSDAFRMTFVFTLRKEKNPNEYDFLWDSKGDYYDKKNAVPRDNSGLTVAFYNRGPNGKFRPQAWLGFGTKTALAIGQYQELAPENEHTLVVEYDGLAHISFILDGTQNARVRVMPGGSLAAPFFNPMIGDRSVGSYFAFNGTIHSLKIEAGMKPAVEKAFPVKAVKRQAFLRNENDGALTFELQAFLPVQKLTLNTTPSRDLGAVDTENNLLFKLPVETRLVPGSYSVNTSLTAELQNGQVVNFPLHASYRVAPVRDSAGIRLIMWGFGDSFHHLKRTGIDFEVDSLSVPFLRERSLRHDKIAAKIAVLDDMLCSRFNWGDYFIAGHWFGKKYPGVDREGNIVHNLHGVPVADPTDPNFRKFMLDVAEEIASEYAGHPAITMLDLHSEIHDKSQPLFGERQRKAYTSATGAKDFPAVIHGKTCPSAGIPDFPYTRIIPDNDPILDYYKWFWTDGDGWKDINAEIAKIYHQHMTPAFRSYFAPSARTAPIWGGNIADIKGQWTYTYPDPIRMTAATDELRAVCADEPGRPIISGIQLICYRSQTAPLGRHTGKEPEWSVKQPDAAYITIPPDILLESVWSTISRQIDGIIFHGDGSLYAPPIKGASIYAFTNAETEPAFSKLLHEVIRPLGPMLKNLPDRPADVAILYSFPSAIFAARGSYGWGGWGMDIHQALQWGGMDPKIIFDQEIIRDRLTGIKVLVLPHCDVMTESVVRIINEFQSRGGIIIADGTQIPAILPDLLVTPVVRSSTNAQEVKQKLQKMGTGLRKNLASCYQAYSSSSDPDLITHVRSFGTADYLFVINDKRCFGDYFGPWKRVMEKGMTNSGNAAVTRKASAVYDLCLHQEVPFRTSGNQTVIPVSFKTSDGKLFLLLSQKIAKWELEVPEQIIAGNAWKITATAKDRTGKIIPALLPIRLEILDGSGKSTDESCYAVAENGVYTREMLAPLNVKKDTMKICITCLASGMQVEKTVQIR